MPIFAVLFFKLRRYCRRSLNVGRLLRKVILHKSATQGTMPFVQQPTSKKLLFKQQRIEYI